MWLKAGPLVACLEKAHAGTLTLPEAFTGIQLYLFGENFGLKAKEKVDAAAALRKVVYQQSSKGKSGFQGGYPRKYTRDHGGG